MNGKRKSSSKNVADNNNSSLSEDDSTDGSVECEDEEDYIERYLTIHNMTFSILPNGGTGDCLFKAISQAIFEGDESEHFPIREQVVGFIAEKTWNKYQVSIQVQHINGHNNLQKSWDENPIGAYKNYMLNAGTLGSFLELNAAGELYQFNFASIQEYNDSVGATYRVENSKQFPNKRVPMHYFLFTGDFDNGHWEYLRNLNKRNALEDGTYSGTFDIVIEGQVSSVEFWLMEHTQIGKTEFDDVAQSIYLRKRSKYPFDCSLLKFENDKTVELIDAYFVITPSKYSDLFSVLANSHLRNESLSKEMHDLLTTYRNNNFSSLNYKLITQPHSHGFTTEVLKYASMSYKGNIQDLLSAADLYGFSFTVYLILGNVIHLGKFVHVDRWGGEVNTMEYFFINMVNTKLNNRTKICAHWYHLVPVKALSYNTPEKPTNSTVSLKKQNSMREIDCEELAAAINLENKKYIKNKAKDLYNLYFERQINPVSDDGGDSSIKPSLLDSENKRLKGEKQKGILKKQDNTVTEGNSHFIEMKPNVFYKYGCVEPISSINRNKSNYIGENSSNIDNKKSHHSMQKVSSQDLRMTPSNLLYARSSFTFNGADRKTRKSKTDESRAKIIHEVPKIAIPPRSIAESKMYSKIVLEHEIKSANPSTVTSEKSIINNDPIGNIIINDPDDLHRKSSEDDARELSELISIEENVLKYTKSKEFVPPTDNSEKSERKDSARTSRKWSSTMITKRDSEDDSTQDSKKTSGKDSDVLRPKDSDDDNGQYSKKVVSRASTDNSDKSERKDSARTSRKWSSTTITKRDSENASTQDYKKTFGKDSDVLRPKDSDDDNGQYSKKVVSRASMTNNERDSKNIQGSDYITRKNSEDMHRLNAADIRRKNSEDICGKNSVDNLRKKSLENCRKNSENIRENNSREMDRNNTGNICEKNSVDSFRKKSLDNSRKTSKNIREKNSREMDRNNTEDICEKNSVDSFRKKSLDNSRKTSKNIRENNSREMDRNNTEDICEKNSVDSFRKESLDNSRKNSENISEKNSREVDRNNTEDICGKNSVDSFRKESLDNCRKNSENMREKNSREVDRNNTEDICGKNSADSFRKELLDNSRKNSENMREKNSREMDRNNTEDICVKVSHDLIKKDSIDIRRKFLKSVANTTSECASEEHSQYADDSIKRSLKNRCKQSYSNVSRGSSDDSNLAYSRDIYRKKSAHNCRKNSMVVCKKESTTFNIEDKQHSCRMSISKNDMKGRRRGRHSACIRGGGNSFKRYSGCLSGNDSESTMRDDSTIITSNDSQTVGRKMRIKAKRHRPKKSINKPEVTLEKEEEISNSAPRIFSSYYYTTESLPIDDSGKSEEKMLKVVRRNSPTSITSSTISSILSSKNQNESLSRSNLFPVSRQPTAHNRHPLHSDINCNEIQKEEGHRSAQSDEECETDICTKYYRHQVFLRKSDGELLPKPKRTSRSVSERMSTLAKNSLSKFKNSKHSQVKPVKYSFCEKNANLSDKNLTVMKAGYENRDKRVNTNQTLSLISVAAGEGQPLIREAIQERMRRESLVANYPSVQTLRSSSCPRSSSSSFGKNRNQITGGRMDTQTGGSGAAGGCLRQICNAIGSICGKN